MRPWITGLDDEISTPVLVVDLDRLEANIRRMALVAESIGARLRPHAKSHKSASIARQQLAAGAVGVCAATVGEVDVLNQRGIGDITLAYPIVGRARLSRLGAVLRRPGTVRLVADSVEVVNGYAHMAQGLGRPVDVLIEIDSGMRRTGCPPQHAAELGRAIASHDSLRLEGILTHAGHAHDVANPVGTAQVARQEVAAMHEARSMLEGAGLSVATVSAGSTLTTPYLRPEDDITEVRPGTYVFNDMRTLADFACTMDQVALSVVTAVVSVSADRFVIDAGSKTLTMTHSATYGYGFFPTLPAARFERLSEEHGVVHLEKATDFVRVGDLLEVHPIHVCVCTDLQREILGRRANVVTERITIDAFRTSQ